MTLRISGKHMDIGDAFRIRIEERIGEAILKYFGGGYSGRVTVEKAGSRYSADCMLNLDTGMALQAAGQGQEPQAAFDAAAERLDKRLRRYKRRLKSHAAGQTGAAWDDIAYSVISPFGEDGEEDGDETSADEAADYAPAIVAESSIALRTMSVAAAVIELDTKDSPVFVFRNAGNEQVNIVYRREDGNIGWIDPSTASGSGATSR